MPATHLSSDRTAPKTPTRAFAVVGKYSDPAAGTFVQHVAILREDADLKYGEEARVWHMQPPLVAGTTTEKTQGAKLQCAVHVTGSIPLDLHEIEAIQDWLSEVDREASPDNPFRRYVVRPHWDWYKAPETGRRLYRRFSCAGFVLECYAYVGIDLLNTEESELPDVDSATLEKAYPNIEKLLARKGLTRADLGIEGNGPWPVVLAGYVLHAMDRLPAGTPRPPAYTPADAGDGWFPREIKPPR